MIYEPSIFDCGKSYYKDGHTHTLDCIYQYEPPVPKLCHVLLFGDKGVLAGMDDVPMPDAYAQQNEWKSHSSKYVELSNADGELIIINSGYVVGFVIRPKS